MASQLSVQDDLGNSVDSSEAIKQELLNELTRLELSLNEAKIIVRLVSRGPAIASDISRDLSMPRTETYHYISSLLGKGVVLSTFSKPRKYYSLSFDEVVDHLVQTKYNTLRSILQNKKDYQRKLDRISSATNASTESSDGGEEDKSYQIIAGEDAIIARIQRILADTIEDVAGMVSERALAMFYHGSILDKFDELVNKGANVRIKTTYGNVVKHFDLHNTSLKIPVVKSISGDTPVEFLVFNSRELILILDDGAGKSVRGFYVNNLAIVSTFLYLYEKL